MTMPLPSMHSLAPVPSLAAQARHVARAVRARLIEKPTALQVLLNRRDAGVLIPYLTPTEDIKAALEAEMDGTANEASLQGFTWGDRMTSPDHLKPSEWVIHKVLPKECTGLLFGGWGTFKTFLAIDWAGAIANGIAWHGRRTTKGTVFYLAGEGEGGFARRLRAWEIANGGTMANLAFREMPEIRNPAELAAMMVDIDQLAAERGEPALIVLDTLFTALNGGDENSGKDMGDVFRAMRAMRQRFRCAVIAVHHTGHEGERARGHSSMPAGVDVQFYVKAKDGLLELANPKQKDGSKLPAQYFTTEAIAIEELVDEEGVTESSLVIRSPAAALLAAAREQEASTPNMDELKAKAVELRGKGWNLDQIAEAVGRHKGTVSKWLKPQD